MCQSNVSFLHKTHHWPSFCQELHLNWSFVVSNSAFEDELAHTLIKSLLFAHFHFVSESPMGVPSHEDMFMISQTTSHLHPHSSATLDFVVVSNCKID